MTDNEIIANEILCIRRRASGKCNGGTDCNTCDLLMNETEIINAYQRAMKQNDLINRQKAEIERLNKNYEELIYKTECLLCHATGNKFSKYTYTIQEMISFVDDYIQDCCDEVVEEAKKAAKSDAIKEFAEELKDNYCFTDRWGKIIPISTVDNLVKEMTEVETNQRKKDEKNG